MKARNSFDNFISFIFDIFNWNDAERTFERLQVIFTILLQLVFLLSFLLALFWKNWTTAFISLVAMVSIWLPIIFIKKRKIHIPVSFTFFLTLFIYASLFLGEIRDFYFKFWWWDSLLHFTSGMALGFVGFLIIYSLYQNGPLESNAGIIALFSFCFALSLGALWEIFEFAMDSFFGLNMQKDGLVDTMWDLIMDAWGALIVSLAGYFYIKYGGKGTGVFRYYLTSYLKKNLNN